MQISKVKRLKILVRDGELVDEIARQVGTEFKVSKKELFQTNPARENLLSLMVISLAGELSGVLTPRMIADARARLEKYLRFIPGLRKKYEKLKDSIKRTDGGS